MGGTVTKAQGKDVKRYERGDYGPKSHMRRAIDLLKVRPAALDRDIAGTAEASIVSSGGKRYLVSAGCTSISSLIVEEGFNSL